eukprot:CAMPEP_0202349712 /NCGR_PEP_ID=MMETSP1126-20121109/7089_1 /ASSEMBLY_ACC=CAM_ASM_000457 /TAXON_ID=3047 /ORGANISM="Dunaliella tertiolecta, Strain CCMP1320" /LENGTH=71 /DNA_ID=CAMNT_0048941567 /DNA_START=171 /DNA_END=386 /DNA_ORIENTATION=+
MEKGGLKEPEMAQQVGKLLQQMQEKFEAASNRIVSKVDDMGARIDDLEKTIADLMEEAEATLPAQEGNPGK